MPTDAEKVARLLAAHQRLAYVFGLQARFGAALVAAGLFLGFLAQGTMRFVLTGTLCGLGLLTVLSGWYYQRKFKRSVVSIREKAVEQGLL